MDCHSPCVKIYIVADTITHILTTTIQINCLKFLYIGLIWFDWIYTFSSFNICCFVKVAGKHIPIYEAYYKQVDSKGIGTIEALAAAKFLKKSGLSDVVLSRVSTSFQ